MKGKANPIALKVIFGRRSRSAASGGCSEAEEGKTTSRQEGIYAVEVCDDCFSGSQGAIPPPRASAPPLAQGSHLSSNDIAQGSGVELPNVIGGGMGAEPPCIQYVSPQNFLGYGHVAHGLVCGSAIRLWRQYGTYSHVGPLHRNQRDFWIIMQISFVRRTQI